MRCPICGSPRQKLRVRCGSKVTYQECLECGVVFQDPAPEPQAVRELYGQAEGAYFQNIAKGANYIAGEAWLRRTARFHISLMERHLGSDWRNRNVLDVGCATGILLTELRARGATVSGIELSEWASRVARERFGLEVCTGRVEDMDFPPGQFDVITAIHVLEHLQDPIGTVQRLCTWLRPGGILVLATPDASSMGARLFRARWKYFLPGEHLYLFSPASLGQFLTVLGLRVIAVEPYLWRHISSAAALVLIPVGIVRDLARWARAQLGGENRAPLRLGMAKDGFLAVATKQEVARTLPGLASEKVSLGPEPSFSVQSTGSLSSML